MCQRIPYDEVQIENWARNFEAQFLKCNLDFSDPYSFKQLTQLQILYCKFKICISIRKTENV